jgi:hypothetical protein
MERRKKNKVDEVGKSVNNFLRKFLELNKKKVQGLTVVRFELDVTMYIFCSCGLGDE